MKNSVQLKVCGMKVPENIEDVAALQPGYLGFIFYANSPRNFEASIPKLSEEIKGVGVFVDAEISFILETVKTHKLKAVQLHGNESVAFCTKLRNELNVQEANDSSKTSQNQIALWKVFSVKDQFDFSQLNPYEGIVDCFLFDTKGKNKGGNGVTFDWTLLSKYESDTPFILSGGIGLDEVDSLREFMKQPQAAKLHAIDVNSKFENKPGLKNADQLKTFITDLYHQDQ